MKALEEINKTREYLDYIERHLNNVKKAWKEMQNKCDDMAFIYDDYSFHLLDAEVNYHDVSKLSEFELVQYRKAFYPTETEEKQGGVNGIKSNLAWIHHKKHNPHHWQNWTIGEYSYPRMWEIHCAHMVIDWMSMSYEFGGTPRKYYEKNKEEIILPEYAIIFIYELFDRLEK